ncbi:hypothetical protein M758_3G081900 [Ceratodon purpureus]|nr:hypothetical protein M758_3G081900 [Ceratodon purpureus]
MMVESAYFRDLAEGSLRGVAYMNFCSGFCNQELIRSDHVTIVSSYMKRLSLSPSQWPEIHRPCCS